MGGKLTLPALQWMATMYSRPCRSHCFAEAQNARTIGSGGAPWSSNGKVAQFEPNLEISYERSLHKLNTLHKLNNLHNTPGYLPNQTEDHSLTAPPPRAAVYDPVAHLAR